MRRHHVVALATLVLSTLGASALPSTALAGSYPDCADYDLVSTFELGGGIKVDSDGRFVIYVANGLMDYVISDEPSLHGAGNPLFVWHGYVESNGIPDLQRHDHECMQVEDWQADQLVW